MKAYLIVFVVVLTLGCTADDPEKVDNSIIDDPFGANKDDVKAIKGFVESTTPTTLEPYVLSVALEDRECMDDGDCTLVLTHCSFCGCGASVNKSQLEGYLNRFSKLCEDYEGPICDMSCSEYDLLCLNQTCTLVPKEPQ